MVHLCMQNTIFFKRASVAPQTPTSHGWWELVCTSINSTPGMDASWHPLFTSFVLGNVAARDFGVRYSRLELWKAELSGYNKAPARLHEACNANKVGAVKVCIVMRPFDYRPLFCSFCITAINHCGTLWPNLANTCCTTSSSGSNCSQWSCLSMTQGGLQSHLRKAIKMAMFKGNMIWQHQHTFLQYI